MTATHWLGPCAAAHPGHETRGHRCVAGHAALRPGAVYAHPGVAAAPGAQQAEQAVEHLADGEHCSTKLLWTRVQGGVTPIRIGTEASIADLALYGYTARAPEGNVSLVPYAAVRAWLERVEALPRFLPFAKSPVGLPA